MYEYVNLLQPNSTAQNPNPDQQRRDRDIRDQISQEIRRKYGKHPDAIKHAAMLIYRDENQKNAEKVHRLILKDPKNGDILMDAFQNRDKMPAKKMPTLTALGFLINQVHTYLFVHTFLLSTYLGELESFTSMADLRQDKKFNFVFRT